MPFVGVAVALLGATMRHNRYDDDTPATATVDRRTIAGVFAEGQASVVAAEISSIIRGAEPSAQYDGRGMCYLEFGHDQVARVDVTFVSGDAPVGDMDGPSEEFAADKIEFGTTRIKRWFGRTWP